MVPDEAFRFPSELGPLTFPGTGTAAHAAYLIIEWAQDNADEGAGPGPGWHRASDVGVGAKLTELADAATVGAGGWRAELVDDPTGLLRDAVVGLLTGLDLVRLDPSTGDWLFAPVTARWRSTAGPSRRPSAGEPRPPYRPLLTLEEPMSLTLPETKLPPGGDIGRFGRRWRLVGAGLSNVWHFGDLELPARSGRLLLRGPNGTGKTTASRHCGLTCSISIRGSSPRAGGGRPASRV